MRKIFGGAMALSALAAVIMGSSLAWKDAKEAVGTATVGTLDWTLNYEPNPGALIGPDGAPPVEVGLGSIHNQGSYNLAWNAAKVVITNAFPGPADVLSCASGNFYGTADTIDLGGKNPIAPDDNNPSTALDGTGAWFSVNLGVLAGAPEACMGDTVTYAVQVEVRTTSPLAPTP